MKIILISIAVFVLVLVLDEINLGSKVRDFSDKCESVGGTVTQIDMGYKRRYSCSVKSLNHFN